ncbi:MAG: carbohydrate kinase family protein [Fastidiosipilaceae bacterium]|jgi:sulfofructose kinase|nr:carbohydrate kinase family protein [Clostridiaceae bacterium]
MNQKNYFSSVKKYDVIGLESPVMDCVLRLANLPRSNTRQQIKDITWQGGGKVSTGLAATTRLGGKTAIIGTIGDDRNGRAVCNEFRHLGIDPSFLLVREQTHTSMSVILSDEETGGRSILFDRDQRLDMTVEELDTDVIDQADYLFVSHFEPVHIKALTYAKEHGIKTFMDSDNLRQGEEVFPYLHLVDYYIASEELYESLYNEPPAGTSLRSRCLEMQQINRGVVIFTLGSRGLAGADENGYFTMPAFDVEVVDTTGAGDVFHGAYLAALLKNYDPREAARYASAAAAIKCTCIGGRAGIPDEATLEHFLNSGIIDPSIQEYWLNYYRSEQMFT